MDKPLDVGDADSVNERRKSVRFDERRRLDVLAGFLSSRDGRKFFFDLLAFCGIGRTVFAQNALNMAHNAGLQSVGLMLLADLTRPELLDKYVQMLKEGAEKDA